jgi:hypothetical protein
MVARDIRHVMQDNRRLFVIWRAALDFKSPIAFDGYNRVSCTYIFGRVNVLEVLEAVSVVTDVRISACI